MLGLVVAKEQPEMEEKKQQLTKDSAEMAKVRIFQFELVKWCLQSKWPPGER